MIYLNFIFCHLNKIILLYNGFFKNLSCELMLAYLAKLIETKFWYVLITLFLLRFGFVCVSGLDLVGDESYYWDWSRRPDWCYYSKPPMVAWMIGALTWLLGDTMPVVRLGAVLLGTGFLAIYYYTAKAFYSKSAAIIALLLILATPANAISNLIMTIDPPLYLFWMATLYYLQAALFEANKKAWWLAGIMAALACLSKPVAIALPLLLALYLLMNKEFQAKLCREYLWFLTPVLLSFVPLIIWNWQHEWITFHHGRSHFEQDSVFNLKQRLQTFGIFIGLEILLLSPVVLLLLVISSATSCLKLFNYSVKDRLLIMMGPVPLIGIFGLSLLQKVQANWPIPFYFTAMILLSGGLYKGIGLKWLKPALLTGFFMVGLAYLLPFTIQALGLRASLDPTSRLRQWQSLAIDINAVRQHLFSNPSDTFLLVDGHRYLVSELAFYLPDHPQVFRLPDAKKVESQYEIWPGPIGYIGKDGLVFSKRSPRQMAEKIGAGFAELKFVETVTAMKGTDNAFSYNIYLARKLKNWPIN